MASRVAGAVLALIAAALLVVSVVAAPWWSGHPKFNGAEIKAKEIGVGPLGAIGCNTGGDGACMSVPVDATFETVGFALAGVTGLLAVTALALALFTARLQPRRKTFAIFVIVGSMIAALLAVVLVFVGPKIRTEAPLPFATGLFVFFGGITAALGSSIFAMRNPPVRAPRVSRPSAPPPQPQPQHQHGGLDVHALLTEDAAIRPSSSGPFGRTAPPVPSPGGALAGPSGPLGGQQPLFSSAPQLRPLYDANPSQGGTGGYVPQQPQSFPMRPPTPIPRDQIAARAGIPTPAMMDAQRSVTMASPGAPPAPPPPPPLDATDRDLLGAAGMRAHPKTLPPPTRSKTASIPPAGPLVQARPLPTLANAVVPPPPNATLATPSTPDPDAQFDAMQTYQRDELPRSAPEVPPIAGLAQPGLPPPATPVPPRAPPSPTTPQQRSKAASIAARVAAMGPPRSPTGAKPVVPMPARPAPTPRPPTKLAEEVSIDTDVSMQAIGEDVQGTESFETATSESTSFARKPEPPTADAPPDDEALTVGRDKISRTDVELPTVRPPTETSQTLSPAPDDATVDVPDTASLPAHADPPDTASLPAHADAPDIAKPTGAPSKLPISTAPDTLPPPTEKQAAASGPSPACPQCEAPMAWVEAHLRFYCKSCKMYF